MSEPETIREHCLLPSTALLLRRYKRFMEAHALKEKLYCNKCAEDGRAEGCKAVVTDGKIEIQCRCTRRYYRGQSY